MRATAVRGLDWLWLGIWGAYAGALGELAARFVVWRLSPVVENSFTLNPQAVWLAPLANLPLFAIVLGGVALVVRRDPWRTRASTALVIALVTLEIALVSERFTLAALIILALGVGAAASRYLIGAWPRARLALRVTALLCVGISVCTGVAWNVRLRYVENREMKSLTALGDSAPNVLLLMLDTVRRRELSLYGNSRETSPVLRQLGAEGIRFDRAFAPSSWTLASHASIFTGHLPHELSVGWKRPLDARHPTLAEQMRAAGYATGGFVGNLLYCNWLYGLDRGFIRYRDYTVSAGEAVYSSSLWRRIVLTWNAATHREDRPGHVTASTINTEFLDWQARLGRRPFFAFLNYFDAHTPYAPPAPFDTMFIGRQPFARTVQWGHPPPPSRLAELRSAYDGAIRYIDTEIGRLLQELDRRGALENTLVIVTSDHGEAFGEHGHLGHGTSLYAPQIRVPLLVLLPRRTVRDVERHNEVSLRDIAATVLETAGISTSALPGRSLSRFWNPNGQVTLTPLNDAVVSELRAPSAAVPSHYPLARGSLSSLVQNGWHLIRQESGREELYFLDTDPLEQHDLAAEPAQAERLRRMRNVLTMLTSRDSGG